MKKQVRHKFHAKPTTRDGIRFDSKKEAQHYDKLMLLKMAGKIVFFLRQVPLHLPGNVTYRVDFLVFFTDGRVEFHDVKGFRTKQYITKKKIVESLYPIEIIEI